MSVKKGTAMLYMSKVVGKARIMRWFASLSAFNLTFHYFQGKLNACADFLSRPLPSMKNPTFEYNNKQMEVFNIWFTNFNNINKMSKKIFNLLITNKLVSQNKINKKLETINCKNALKLSDIVGFKNGKAITCFPVQKRKVRRVKRISAPKQEVLNKKETKVPIKRKKRHFEQKQKEKKKAMTK